MNICRGVITLVNSRMIFNPCLTARTPCGLMRRCARARHLLASQPEVLFGKRGLCSLEETFLPTPRVPAHRLTGYTVRGVLYGSGDIPLERRVIEVSTLASGEQATIKVQFTEKEPLKIVFDVLRPTAFSAYTHLWLV